MKPRFKLLIDLWERSEVQRVSFNDSSFSYPSKAFVYSIPSSSINRNFTFHQFFLTPSIAFPDFLTPFEPYISILDTYIPSPFRINLRKISRFNANVEWWFLKGGAEKKPAKKRRFGRRMFAEKSQPAYPVYSGLMTRLRTFVRVTRSFRGGERERERGPAH